MSQWRMAPLSLEFRVDTICTDCAGSAPKALASRRSELRGQ